MANNQVLLIVFVALTGAAVMLQAFVLLAIFFAVRRTARKAEEQMEEVRTTVFPLVKDTRELLSRVGPRIDSITTDLAELTQGLRAQGEELQISSAEIMERVRRQSSRLDGMFSGVLDTLDRSSAIVTDLVNIPLRQLSGFAAFAKAAIGSLRSGNTRRGPAQQPTHSPADKDMFV